MGRLSGKHALITGGTSGIGLETAKRFLQEGARVVVTGTNPDTLAAAQKELAGATVVSSDAGSLPAQQALAALLKSHYGTLDVVFVNAGIATFLPAGLWDEAAWNRQMDINLKGPFFLLQALLPMLKNPSSVILNASISADVAMPNTSVYSASKAALLALARGLSIDWVDKGVRVNAVSPGPVATPIFGKLGLPADQLQAAASGIQSLIPLKRFGTPLEIANAAVFLASDESSFMLGSEIVVDGGMSVA